MSGASLFSCSCFCSCCFSFCCAWASTRGLTFVAKARGPGPGVPGRHCGTAFPSPCPGVAPDVALLVSVCCSSVVRGRACVCVCVNVWVCVMRVCQTKECWVLGLRVSECIAPARGQGVCPVGPGVPGRHCGTAFPSPCPGVAPGACGAPLVPVCCGSVVCVWSCVCLCVCFMCVRHTHTHSTMDLLHQEISP